MTSKALNLKSNIIKSLGSKYLSYVFQVISLVFYARLFTPETQGLVALLLAINMFFITVSEGTITTSLITRSKLSTSQVDGVFTFSIFIGLISIMLSYFICKLYLSFSHLDCDEEIVYLMSIGVFFNILLTVPKSLLYLKSKYYYISLSLILSEVITLALIYASYTGDSALLFSLKFLTIPFITFIFFFFYCYKINGKYYKLSIDFSGVFSIADFLKNSFGFNSLNYFSRNLDNLLFAKFFDAMTLGLYEKSYSLMKYPIQLLTSAVSPAIQPSLTHNGFDVAFAEKCYDIVFNRLMMLGFTMSVFIQINADFIVTIILGDNWIGVAPIISILSLSLPIQIVTSFNGGFWNGADKANLQLKVSFINFMFFIPSLVLSFLFFDEINVIVIVVSLLLFCTCSYACVEIRKKLFDVSRVKTAVSIIMRNLIFMAISMLISNFEFNSYYMQIVSLLMFICLFIWVAICINLELKGLSG